ncbi:DUF6319 family protein [Gandjariella thermophila]|uniref:Uncharacterized protein n=1 Tax=Gandjariella thermophila TaxID=1931992 RepID=A0A4D4IXQ4_9PSEU|nr:DUF6319 family protein [Gandjariella thermophila]GDY29001.1 hypothetical protein GTS_06340 [Gandjariella thermophila]
MSADPAAAADSTDQAGAAENGAESGDSGRRATPSGEKEAPARGRGRKQSSARKTRTVALTLTVTGTAEGDWQADLVHGTNRLVRGMPIPAAAVARAAKELHPDIESGIEAVLSEAREQHRSRMQELEAELERVKRALADLGE